MFLKHRIAERSAFNTAKNNHFEVEFKLVFMYNKFYIYDVGGN
jgi:hypothetical protein